MIRADAVLVAAALFVMAPLSGHAQYGYPAGYGGYGWGGWGSTPGSALARGMGYFNMGRGAFNEQTAVAGSINTNTVMRWNEYVSAAHQNNLRAYAARQSAEHARNLRDRAGIHDRLRNHPSTRDITDGDALDVVLDELQNNAVSATALSQLKTPIPPALIAEIPFALASEGMTICLDRMTLNETWPLALRVEAFKPEREGLRQAILAALDEDKSGNLQPETIKAVQAAIDRLRLKFEQTVPQDNPDFVPAQETVKAIAGITKMLYSPKVEEILAELEKYPGTTLGDLLAFMQAFNLRFAPANSLRQRQLYLKLYPMLREPADALVAAQSGGAAGAVTGAIKKAEGVGGEAVQAAEDVGEKTYTGLRSAAIDLFKNMDWKHFSL